MRASLYAILCQVAFLIQLALLYLPSEVPRPAELTYLLASWSYIAYCIQTNRWAGNCETACRDCFEARSFYLVKLASNHPTSFETLASF